jgi:hypothetical protein
MLRVAALYLRAGAGGLVRSETDGEKYGRAREVQHVVSGVDSKDVERGTNDEESDDSQNKVDGTNGGVERTSGRNAREARDEKSGTNKEVCNVVEDVDLKQSEQQASAGVDESDPCGDGEPEKANKDVNGAEDNSEQTVR